FLDVALTNNNGTLSTSVYHKPAAEPYVVPFISDHPRHTFVDVIKTSLTRALRNSSTFEIFNNERIYIKLSLLYNGTMLLLISTGTTALPNQRKKSNSNKPNQTTATSFIQQRSPTE
ncbi:unnamed protein product, partial [Rotaria socialis]